MTLNTKCPFCGLDTQWVLYSPYGKIITTDKPSFLAAKTLLSILDEKYSKLTVGVGGKNE